MNRAGLLTSRMDGVLRIKENLLVAQVDGEGIGLIPVLALTKNMLFNDRSDLKKRKELNSIELTNLALFTG